MDELSVPVNDCHIHIGNSASINRTFEPVHLKDHPAKKVLLMSAQDDIKTNNNLIKNLSGLFPDVYGLYWITSNNWYYPMDKKMVGCKFHGAYENMPISNERYHPIKEYLNDNDAVLMVHCGRYKEGEIKSNTSFLHALMVAQDYPNIKVIMAHMGGTDTTVSKKAVKAAANQDNIYFDTSGITTPYIIEYAVDHLGPKRILFGSDAPWCSFKAMYHTVMDANIPEEDKRNIMYDNFNLLVERKCESIPIQ